MDGGEIRGAGNAWICPEVSSWAMFILLFSFFSLGEELLMFWSQNQA